jgi:UDP-N-acetylglucosamine/UDP-N-acetylgalactosamine diphosphorylase
VEETGFLLLEQGQVAAFLVAGGQGSRLGFEGPKGAYDIGLPSKKSLFQIQAERISNLSARAGHPIPWCIMTSPLNHEDTITHFEDHHFFGLPRDSIRFFSQALCSLWILTEKRLRVLKST